MIDLRKGDCLEELDKLKENNIDSIVCDPPYELNFMNKGWDNDGISFNKETWGKCYRVLKPGGYLLAFGGSRTYHRIACAIEDAGFEIRDTIMWIYGSGFPKSMDISKAIDKRNGRNFNQDFKDYLNKQRNKKRYSLADINRLMETATNGGGFASSIMGDKHNIILPTKENYLKLKIILDLDNRFDELINTSEAEREVIGKGKAGLTKGSIANFAGNTEFDITLPSTDLAKQWQGWGTCLKPAFEPVIVARKPFKGSLVDNVINNGVGGLNIDECRVGNEERTYKGAGGSNTCIQKGALGNGTGKDLEFSVNGRFPANVILTYDDTDYEEVCGGFPNRDKPNGNIAKKYKMNNQVYGDYGYCNTWEAYKDSGSASRYFYCAKASKKDRDEGLEGKNIHPTVKPTTLIQYLVRLVTPKGGTILDPFMGSGSTGKAVMYENKERKANYSFIGIELDEKYFNIAKERIENASFLVEQK